MAAVVLVLACDEVLMIEIRRVAEMKAAGKSVRAIAEALGISVGSVHGMLEAAA